MLYQLLAVVSSLILPRYFLSYFGSETNGLVNSITQFLSYIALLDLGVGAVFQSALYKPLAQNDEKEINGKFDFDEPCALVQFEVFKRFYINELGKLAVIPWAVV